MSPASSVCCPSCSIQLPAFRPTSFQPPASEPRHHFASRNIVLNWTLSSKVLRSRGNAKGFVGLGPGTTAIALLEQDGCKLVSHCLAKELPGAARYLEIPNSVTSPKRGWFRARRGFSCDRPESENLNRVRWRRETGTNWQKYPASVRRGNVLGPYHPRP